MSGYKQREGTAKLLKVPVNLSFEDSVEYICQTQINFPYSVIDEDLLEWKYGREQVIYVNNQFWHIFFTVKLDGSPYVYHGVETDEGIDFIFLYHDSGAYFEDEFHDLLSDLSENSIGV